MRYDIYEIPVIEQRLGRTVFLLGQSKNGPINSPIPIRSLDKAKAVFGPEEEGNLVRAYRHASLNSDIDIYLMRVTGEYARSSLLGNINNTEQPAVKLRSIYGGKDYNYISFQIRDITNEDGTTEKALVFEMPTGYNIAYPLSIFRNLSELVAMINVDTQNGDNYVYASTEFGQEPVSCLLNLNGDKRFLAGGHDGLDITKNELYLALERSYQILEGREVDYICPVPARFNDTYPGFYDTSGTYGDTSYSTGDHLTLVDTENNNRYVTFHEQLIQFCKNQERNGIMTHGILGLREIDDLSKLNRDDYSYIIELLDTTAFSTRDGLVDRIYGKVYDNGHYISIVGHDLVFNQGTDDEHYANGCALYIGLLASTPISETTTNMALPEGVSLRYEYTSSELNDLAFMGVVAMRNSVKKGPVVSNGVTASLYDTEFHTVANVRMVQYTIAIINQTVDNLIGEPMAKSIIGKELQQRITVALKTLQNRGILIDYDFDIEFSRSTRTGEVNLQLRPRYAVEFIGTGAMLNFNN